MVHIHIVVQLLTCSRYTQSYQLTRLHKIGRFQ